MVPDPTLPLFAQCDSNDKSYRHRIVALRVFIYIHLKHHYVVFMLYNNVSKII